MFIKQEDIEIPDRGFVFWPVGNGDSTTIVINDETVVQIDLHHIEDSAGDDDPHVPIVDQLVDILPEKDGNPYLVLCPERMFKKH